MSEPTADPRIADIVEAGVIRLALFLPNFVETSTGEIDPRGVGLVGQGLLGPLAKRLKVNLELIGRPSPTDAIKTLVVGDADAIFMGIQGSRQSLVAVTAPVIRFDYGYMVPDGSPIMESSEVDRSGCRISAVRGLATGGRHVQTIRQESVSVAIRPSPVRTLERPSHRAPGKRLKVNPESARPSRGLCRSSCPARSSSASMPHGSGESPRFQE